jgi:Listeria-Bacteroides repeat domain (List_Bact_rpt)
MSFTLTYDPNGATTGNVPNDATKHNANDSVTVLPPTTDFTRKGEMFARWYTTADGASGNPFSPKATLKMPSSNTTLFAQWYTTNGLVNSGSTDQYLFFYESGLAARGIEPARTNLILTALSPGPGDPPISLVEKDVQTMTAWFGGLNLKSALQSATGDGQIHTYVQNTGFNGSLGAGWNSDALPRHMNLNSGPQDTNFLHYLMVSEVTEMFMKVQNAGWFDPAGHVEQSCGEGLSRFLASRLREAEGLAFVNGFELAPFWLNSLLPITNLLSTQTGRKLTELTVGIDSTSTEILVDAAYGDPFATTFLVTIDQEIPQVNSINSDTLTYSVTRGVGGTTAASHAVQAEIHLNYGPRSDYVNLTLEGDIAIDAATGCAILFLYYLHTNLGFSETEVVTNAPGVGNAATCLRGVYRNLTKDLSDPFLNHYWTWHFLQKNLAMC